MLEKINTSKYKYISEPSRIVLEYLKEIIDKTPNLVFYEIGVGIGATTLGAAKLLNNNGQIVLFSREADVIELTDDLIKLGYTNINSRWGSPNNTYSGYHFELAKAFSQKQLPGFDLAYIDGGHLFHLDAPASCVLKELCKPGGYMIFDDYYWSLEKSPTMNPSIRSKTKVDFDINQIKECHVKLVCDVVMDTDYRFSLIGIKNGKAIYQRIK